MAINKINLDGTEYELGKKLYNHYLSIKGYIKDNDNGWFPLDMSPIILTNFNTKITTENIVEVLSNYFNSSELINICLAHHVTHSNTYNNIGYLSTVTMTFERQYNGSGFVPSISFKISKDMFSDNTHTYDNFSVVIYPDEAIDGPEIGQLNIKDVVIPL